MKKFAFLLALGLVMGASSVAMAQDGGDTRSKFYNFDDMLIDGEFKKPELSNNKARKRADFKRLSNLKKSFLPKVRKTTEERTLQ